MREERMMILRLLKEGKISEEEADKLIDALGKSNSKEDDFEKEFDSNDSEDDFSDEINYNVNKLGGFISNLTTSITSTINQSIEDALEKEDIYQYDVFTNKDVFHETFNVDINNIQRPNIYINSMNGKIQLIPHSDEDIKVKAKIYSKKSEYENINKLFDYTISDNNISIFFKDDIKFSAYLKVFIPIKEYQSLNISNKNGSIIVDNIILDNLNLNTKNANIQISNITSHKSINLETKNGKILFKNIITNNFNAHTKNAKISGANIKSSFINLLTKNNHINLQELSYSNLKEIKFNTANGNIILDDTIPKNKCFLLNLETSNGKVLTNLDINYEIKKESTREYIIKGSTNNKNKDIKEGTDHCDRENMDLPTCEIIALTKNGNISLF